MPESQNPFASPQADQDIVRADFADSTEAELIRRQYLKHEASVKSIGILYYLGGILGAIVGLSMFAIALSIEPLSIDPAAEVVMFLFGALYVGIAVLSMILGRGLRILSARVRIPVVVFAAIGLLAFPIGTLINLYILYLVLSAKGAMVLSVEYKDVIRQTPHIKYRTSLLAWIVLAIFVALLIAAIAAVLAV